MCCFCNVQAAVLIYKAEATVDQGEKQVVLGAFDASRYRQIRIAVFATTNTEIKIIAKEEARTRLMIAQRELKRYEGLYQSGITSKSEYDRYVEDVRSAQDASNRAENIAGTSASVYGIEGLDTLWLAGASNERNLNFMSVIEVPPPRIQVTVGGRGKYRLYVWAL